MATDSHHKRHADLVTKKHLFYLILHLILLYFFFKYHLWFCDDNHMDQDVRTGA